MCRCVDTSNLYVIWPLVSMLWLVGYHCWNLSNSPVQKQEKQAFGKNKIHIVSMSGLFSDALAFD